MLLIVQFQFQVSVFVYFLLKRCKRKHDNAHYTCTIQYNIAQSTFLSAELLALSYVCLFFSGLFHEFCEAWQKSTVWTHKARHARQNNALFTLAPKLIGEVRYAFRETTPVTVVTWNVKNNFIILT